MKNLAPHQVQGKQVDLSHSKVFTANAEAIACFRRAYQRLLHPNGWHTLCGVLSAAFCLCDADGNPLPRPAEIHDYIRIDIPGPGPTAGGGYDWVQVVRMGDRPNTGADKELVALTVKPCPDPGHHDAATAHFFTNHGSSTFVIERNGGTVTSFYHGRNEVPNIKTDNPLDNVRNAIVASGAMALLSEAQWMKLIKAFLETEDSK